MSPFREGGRSPRSPREGRKGSTDDRGLDEEELGDRRAALLRCCFASNSRMFKSTGKNNSFSGASALQILSSALEMKKRVLMSA